MSKLNWPGSACPTISRPSQHHPNPSPNMTDAAYRAAHKKQSDPVVNGKLSVSDQAKLRLRALVAEPDNRQPDSRRRRGSR